MKSRVDWIQDFAQRLMGHTVTVRLTPDVKPRAKKEADSNG